MSSETFWRGATDCAACGASIESGMAMATITDHGSSTTCECCGMQTWQGSVVARGHEISPATVIRRVRAARPDVAAKDAYREPWERRIVWGLEPAPTIEGWGRDERRELGHRIAVRTCPCCAAHQP